MGNVNLPLIDKKIFEICASICSKCSPKNNTKSGAGVGAVGGFLFGGLIGAAVGAAVGALGGSKMSEEAHGEKYYQILRESISTLYNYLKNEVVRMVAYTVR